MAGKEWFEEWFESPYYHKLYFERDAQEASALIRRLVDHLGILPGSRLLDAACGRGRHAQIFASLGFDVTGVDLSPASIEYAKARAGEQFAPNLHFFIHDLRLPFWGNFFDYAFNFFTSFGYFRTRREHDAAMRTLARGLKPGGTLVLDYLNVHYAEDHLVPSEKKLIDGTTYSIRRWQDATHFFKQIRVSDNSLPGEQEYTEKVAKFTLGDFTDMLAYRDMQVQEVFGDYSLGRYEVKTAPRMIIVAKRSESLPGDREKRLYSDGRRTDALT